jgi:hypothetical protein
MSQLIAKRKAYPNNMEIWKVNPQEMHFEGLYQEKEIVFFKYSNSAPLSFTRMSTNKAEGRREDILLKQRNQMREEYERQKQSLINETEKARPSTNRFVGQNDSMEESLKNNTIGLVRLEDFQKKKKELEEAKAREAARSNDLKYVSFLIFLLLFLCALDSRKTRWLIGCGEYV